MDHTFVLGERIVLRRRSAFRVEALNRGAQTAEVVATIDEGRLRKQQNEKDDENY
jgi:hypothetical protein